MTSKKTTLFWLIGIVICLSAISVSLLFLINIAQNISDADYKPKLTATSQSYKDLEPKATPTPSQTPSAVKIVSPTIPQPTMKEIPEIFIKGLDSAAVGDKLLLKFQIDSKSEKIVGLGIDISFNSDLIAVQNIDILDADTGDRGTSTTGEISNGAIHNVAIMKRDGIVGEFLIIEFETLKAGDAKIEAQITAISETYASEENLKVSKIIVIYSDKNKIQ